MTPTRFSTTFLRRGLILFGLALLLLPHDARALAPEEILVIANRRAEHSLALAQFYMRKRMIPDANLIVLEVTTEEACSRDEYAAKIALPVSHRLQEPAAGSPRIRCLLLMHGMPLKISAPLEAERRQLKELRKQARDPASQDMPIAPTDKQTHPKLKEAIHELQLKTPQASLDSEIALIRAQDYPLEGWIPNPYYLGFREQALAIAKEDVLMVSRLDGPSPEIVRKMIEDSIRAEENGLAGTVYFDARWPASDRRDLSGYALYDQSIHRAADRVRQSQLLPVVVNDTSELFQPGECPNAALYCGWYRRAHYVDAFVWQKGAVGYHIASSECKTLRKKGARLWCKMMLEKGAAATIGPVGEPFVQGFPLPEIFFALLVDGYLSLAECYLVSLPYLSWQMVLIGDPLYRPFDRERSKPQKKAAPGSTLPF
ncbi:MAG: TIGR03790 family protein [Desulfobacterales bacterium]|nr:MAG: TIGR03790 family protein [Desulfobacterales bacterium]